MGVINDIEAGKICGGQANISVSNADCVAITEQIRKQGLSAYFFNIMKTVKQLGIEMNQVSPDMEGDRFVALAIEQLTDYIAEFVDELTLVILPSQDSVQ